MATQNRSTHPGNPNQARVGGKFVKKTIEREVVTHEPVGYRTDTTGFYPMSDIIKFHVGGTALQATDEARWYLDRANSSLRALYGRDPSGTAPVLRPLDWTDCGAPLAEPANVEEPAVVKPGTLPEVSALNPTARDATKSVVAISIMAALAAGALLFEFWV